MLQDIAPYSFCNDFAWINPEPTDGVLVYRGSSVLVAVDTTPQNASGEAREGTLRFPTFEMLNSIGAAVSDSAEIIQRADGMTPEAVFLFTVGDTGYFRCETDCNVLDELIEGRCIGCADDLCAQTKWQFMPISQLKQFGPKNRAFAGLVGFEYNAWYATRRFCGRCGTPLVHDMVERMVERGSAEYLGSGGRLVGRRPFRVTGSSEAWDKVYSRGELAKATLTISLEEYA